MKIGILTIILVLLCSAFLFAQQPYVIPQPVLSAPVYQYVPVGRVYYTPRPAYRIHYPTPFRSWLFGSYVGGGYTSRFIPMQQAHVR